MRRLVVIGILASVFAVWEAAPALGCSCAAEDPSAMFENSDAAFIGTLAEAPEFEPNQTTAVWIFEVDQWVKGDLGATVGVHSGFGGGDCGFEVGVGEEIGVFLYNDQGRPSGGLCSTTTPDAMRAAGEPLVFDGSGPPAFLLWGQSGRTRLVTLDTSGGMLAASGDDRFSWTVSVCPEGGTVVEVVEGDVIVRRLADLSQKASFTPPGAAELSNLWCLEPDGKRLLGLFVDWEDERGWVADLGEPGREMVSGPAESLGQAVVSGSVLAYQPGGAMEPVTLVDLASGARIDLGGGGDVYRVMFSPSGDLLFVARTVHHGGGWDLHYTIHRADDGLVVNRLGPIPNAEPYGWLGEDELVIAAYDDPEGAASTQALDVEAGTGRPLTAPGFGHVAVEGGVVSIHEGGLWFTAEDGAGVQLASLPSEAHQLTTVLDTGVAPAPAESSTTTTAPTTTVPAGAEPSGNTPAAAPTPAPGPATGAVAVTAAVGLTMALTAVILLRRRRT